MRIRSALPVDIARGQLRNAIQRHRRQIPFVRPPIEGLVGSIEGEYSDGLLVRIRLWNGFFHFRTLRATLHGDARGSELVVRVSPTAFAIKKWSPAVLVAGILVSLLVASFRFIQDGEIEQIAVVVGIAGFLASLLVALVYYARRLPVPLPERTPEIAELARVLQGEVVPPVGLDDLRPPG